MQREMPELIIACNLNREHAGISQCISIGYHLHCMTRRYREAQKPHFAALSVGMLIAVKQTSAYELLL